MGNISLTPSELLSQSKEMEALSQEFQGLFGNVSSVLKNMNNNWSENLANNFEGKITSASKAFQSVAEMLQTGSRAASESANTFETTDSLIAKLIDPNVLGTGGIVGNIIADNSVDNHVGTSSALDGIKDFVGEQWNSLNEEWNNAGSAMEWIDQWYDGQVPKELQGEIEGIAKKILGKQLYTAVDITHDLITGNLSWDNAKDVLGIIIKDSATAKGLTNAIDYFIDPSTWDRKKYYDDIAYNKYGTDFFATMTTEMGEFVDVVVLGSVQCVGNIVTGIVDDMPVFGGLVEYVTGDTLSEHFNNGIGHLQDATQEFFVSTAESVEKVDELIKSMIKEDIKNAKDMADKVVNVGKQVVDKVADAGKQVAKAGKWISNGLKNMFS